MTSRALVRDDKGFLSDTFFDWRWIVNPPKPKEGLDGAPGLRQEKQVLRLGPGMICPVLAQDDKNREALSAPFKDKAQSDCFYRR